MSYTEPQDWYWTREQAEEWIANNRCSCGEAIELSTKKGYGGGEVNQFKVTSWWGRCVEAGRFNALTGAHFDADIHAFRKGWDAEA